MIMKKYRLKKWYPSLPIDWIAGIEVRKIEGYPEGSDYYFFCQHRIDLLEVERNPEFWEEVKEVEETMRLFANSMDEYPIYYGDQYYYIDSDYRLHTGVQLRYNPEFCPKELIFKNKLNAENYIWDNKPLFSRKQILNAISKSGMSDHASINKISFYTTLKYWG
jgi:hypothetical protein